MFEHAAMSQGSFGFRGVEQLADHRGYLDVWASWSAIRANCENSTALTLLRGCVCRSLPKPTRRRYRELKGASDAMYQTFPPGVLHAFGPMTLDLRGAMRDRFGPRPECLLIQSIRVGYEHIESGRRHTIGLPELDH